jgi:Fe-S cluster assembly protein SufD
VSQQQPFSGGLDAWIETLSTNGGGWSADLRRAAATRYRELGLPGRKDEDWRQINLSAISEVERRVPDAPATLDLDTIERFEIADLDAIRVVLVDGFLVPELSEISDLPAGVSIESLYGAAEAGREPAVVGLRRDGGDQATGFEALNAAWFRDGLLLRVEADVKVERPVHVLHVSTKHDQPTVVHPRIVVAAGRSAEATVVEDHVALDDSDDFVNAVVDLQLDENAHVEWVRVVRTGAEHLHVGSIRSRQARDSRLREHAMVVDGELVRQDVRAHLQGSNSEVTLNGLVVLDEKQVADNHTWVHHEVPHTRSEEVYRNVLDGKARGVFMGRVVVAEGAKGTDAQQNNANLLLSNDAQINTLPQLEIYNDDVKASHGATLGQLDQDGLFYLRSRGIDEATARGLLTFAFASTVVESMPLRALRRFARRSIFEHLPHEHLSEELV